MPNEDIKKSLQINFTKADFLYRLYKASINTELIAKAVNLKKYKNIIDATAGLGKDSFILAKLGGSLRMVEQNKAVFDLLNQAISSALVQGPFIRNIATRIKLHHANAIDFLQNLKPEDYPDVIYLDPMFPPSNKSAAVKLDMQLLSSLVKDDYVNNNNLLNIALLRAKNRVVVKRHKLSSLLSDKNPNIHMIGKSNRFDIYLTA